MMMGRQSAGMQDGPMGIAMGINLTNPPPLIIIIKGHSLRRACLQPATNTQNSKPRPPTTNTTWYL